MDSTDLVEKLQSLTPERRQAFHQWPMELGQGKVEAKEIARMFDRGATSDQVWEMLDATYG